MSRDHTWTCTGVAGNDWRRWECENPGCDEERLTPTPREPAPGSCRAEEPKRPEPIGGEG